MPKERGLFTEGYRKLKLKAVSGIMLPLLMASIFIILSSPIPIIAQTNSATTVFLDPPTITGVTVGETFTVNLTILDAPEVFCWQADMTFNATVLECISYSEGEFLETGGKTTWFPGTIDNVAGMTANYGCCLSGTDRASGSGRLAYANFTVIAHGVSDIHLRDVKVSHDPPSPPVSDYIVPINIIDVFTVVVAGTPHTAVTVSNSTGKTFQHSGFSDHVFNETLKEISFKVSSPDYPDQIPPFSPFRFSNVTIPKTLLNASILDKWYVIIGGISVSKTVTENATHYSIYFTYTLGIHEVQIRAAHSVGGIYIPVNKLELLAPYSGLTILLAVAVVTVVYVKKRKRHTEISS